MIGILMAAMIFVQTPTVNGEPVEVYLTGMVQTNPPGVPVMLSDHVIDTEGLEGEWVLIIQTGKAVEECPPGARVYNHPLEKAIEGLREAANIEPQNVE